MAASLVKREREREREVEKKRLFCGSSETEAGTLRESIITVDSGRLCSGPVPVSYAGMASGQRE